MNMENEVKVFDAEIIDTGDKATCDVQIATARQFPRNITKTVNNMIAIATMDKDTASSCGYALPRSGKTITGGSVHLAKIIAQNWGNMRVESKVSKITATNIYSEAVAWDLETNTAIKVEASRKITKRDGSRFNEDLITLTGQVTSSIALRNAVFGVVPKSVVDKVYNASLALITGDLSDEQKLVKKRKQVIDGFNDTYGVSESEILKALGLNTTNQIKADQVGVLIGMGNALKEGSQSVDTMFNRISEDQKKDLFDNPQAVK